MSEENFGADPPMGSKKMYLVEKQYIYLKLGVGAPWAGQVSENGEDCLASDVMILEMTDIWGAEATNGSIWKQKDCL